MGCGRGEGWAATSRGFADAMNAQVRRRHAARVQRKATPAAHNECMRMGLKQALLLSGFQTRLRRTLQRWTARGPALSEQSVDPLTGFLRRDGFVDALGAARQAGIRGVVALIDLDNFKQVNDAWGHGVGDQVLQEAARRIASSFQAAGALLSRWGGDEFLVFLPMDTERATALIQDCMDAIRRPMHLDGMPAGAHIHVTLSAGLAALPERGPVDNVLRSVDAALFAAKTSGRDKVLCFDEEVGSVIGRRRELAAALSILQDRNRELTRLVQTDALTGLRNRHALNQVLPIEVGGETGGWKQCSVAFLDIDHFGDYNHLHGDSQGDDVLRKVADTISQAARQSDFVFRKGGEELVVVLPETSLEAARAVAERMREAVLGLGIRHQGSKVAPVVSVTVGVASAGSVARVSVQKLMERASELAMQAKIAHRRNEVHHCNWQD